MLALLPFVRFVYHEVLMILFVEILLFLSIQISLGKGSLADFGTSYTLSPASVG